MWGWFNTLKRLRLNDVLKRNGEERRWFCSKVEGRESRVKLAYPGTEKVCLHAKCATFAENQVCLTHEYMDGTTNFPQGMDEERWMELLKLSGAGQLNRR